MLRRGFVGFWQSPASVRCAVMDPNSKGVHPTIEALAVLLAHGRAPHVAVPRLIIPSAGAQDSQSAPTTPLPRSPCALFRVSNTRAQSTRKPYSHTQTYVDKGP